MAARSQAAVRLSQMSPHAALVHEIVAGLTARPKRISPKYFYDEAGARLFDAITQTPEYYLTRCEVAILREHSIEIARHIPDGAAMVEFGSGSSTKARILIAAAPAIAAYVPVDISAKILLREVEELRRDRPGLAVLPVETDFSQAFALPAEIAALRRVGFFPGSTLGNFEPHEACAFLRHAARILGDGATLIIGVDLVKDANTLDAAYNDAAGITAKFNLNLLDRINRELNASFDPASFSHYAFYNAEQHRIEMHLVSKKRQKVKVGGRSIEFRSGETIHTENSYKYTLDSFTALARGSGWTPLAAWTDADGKFSVHVLVFGAAEEAVPPRADLHSV